MVELKRPTAVLVAKLRSKDLGNPKMAAALPDGDDHVVWLGTIIGKASGVKRFVDPSDETKVSWALKGLFEATPENIDQSGNAVAEKYRKPVMRSGICWLPGGFHETVVEAVTAGDPYTKVPNIVAFRCRIGTIKAGNKAGYEYRFDYESSAAESADDPLADLRAKPAQLTHQSDVEESTAEESTAEESTAEESTTRRRRGRNPAE